MKEEIINNTDPIQVQETIEKVSETEIKITTVKPQVVIPKEIIEETFTLDSLEENKAVIEAEITRLETAKKFDIQQYENALAKHDSMIDPKKEELAIIEARIAEAVKQGVKTQKVNESIVIESSPI